MSSTQQLQEIIVDNSIRSFNQGYNAGRNEEQARTIELLEKLLKELKGETK